MTPYNLETTAYEYLRHAGIEYYIPRVYGNGYRTVKRWGLEEIEGDRYGKHYGILMECVVDFKVLGISGFREDLELSIMAGASLKLGAGGG